jgi:DNA polymerase-3 subunit gamma/tau
MSEALEHKYRPKTFNDVLGNQTTIDALELFIKSPNKPTTYLFTGEYGSGKTTLSRILAQELGCSLTNIKEFNMASSNGVDDIRELETSASSMSMFTAVKVYILDEVHQLTKAGQSAALKLFEEPAKDTYFILCTNEPNKLLPTIRSRCQTFQVEMPTYTELKRYLKYILSEEQKTLDNIVLDTIINVSEYHIRNALVLLSKVIDLEPQYQLEAINSLDKDEEDVLLLCKSLMRSDRWSEVAEQLSKLKGDAETYRRCILGYAKSVLLKSENERAYKIIKYMKDDLFNSGLPGLVANCYGVIND